MVPSGSANGIGMNGPLRRTVIVANPNGLHMRPATVFAEAARHFRSGVTVWCAEKRADGKSSLDLILLTALPGAELILEVDGDDADSALAELAGLLEAVGEEY